MKMYVANTTKQNFDFSYRVLEETSLRTQMIPMGGQVALSDDLNQGQIDNIVKHHARYGMIRADEIDRARPFVGYCYSIDKPVSIATITKAMHHNTTVLMERGRHIRQEAAIAESGRIESALADAQAPVGLRNFEMAVIEENNDGSTGLDPISEGTIVDRSAPPGINKSSKQSRRR